MQLILISGLSGSGKSIALNVLEDAAFYCVDNLPTTLLPQLVQHLRASGCKKVAVAVDVRSGASIAAMPQVAESLRGMVADLRFIFLDSRTENLVTRFSETRRRHPLSDSSQTLEESIEREREFLGPIAELGHRIDTSSLHPNTLRNWVRDIVGVDAKTGLTLLFSSFGFKHGLPIDADMVFDVRCLPNPYYDPALRPLTGCDAPVIEFLEHTPAVIKMSDDIQRFVNEWLPSFISDGRSYFTVGIGCTGGQHRSVYIAERLAKAFRASDLPVQVLIRHRSFK